MVGVVLNCGLMGLSLGHTYTHTHTEQTMQTPCSLPYLLPLVSSKLAVGKMQPRQLTSADELRSYKFITVVGQRNEETNLENICISKTMKDENTTWLYCQIILI